MKKFIDILIAIWVLGTIGVDIRIVIKAAAVGVWAKESMIRFVLLLIIVVVGVLDYYYFDKD